MLFIGERYIDHLHKWCPSNSAIQVFVYLLQILCAALRSYWDDESPSWPQLIYELKEGKEKKIFKSQVYFICLGNFEIIGRGIFILPRHFITSTTILVDFQYSHLVIAVQMGNGRKKENHLGIRQFHLMLTIGPFLNHLLLFANKLLQPRQVYSIQMKIIILTA